MSLKQHELSITCSVSLVNNFVNKVAGYLCSRTFRIAHFLRGIVGAAVEEITAETPSRGEGN